MTNLRSGSPVYAYKFETRWGPVSLVPTRDLRYDVMFEDENFGNYHTAEMAADDVGGGHTHTPSSGLDFDQMGVSGDLSDWTAVLVGHIK